MVIVGSILLAFAIDAGWDNRIEDQRRDALLTAVGNDMARARDEIERVYDHHKVGQSAAADLLAMTEMRPGDPVWERRVDSLVAHVWGSTASYDAPVGAMESLFGAGALDLVGDPELAFELTAYPAMIADLGWEQRLLQDGAMELHSWLGDQGVDASRSKLRDFDVPWETGPNGAARRIESPRFRGIVSMIYYRYTNTSGTLESMRDAIGRIEERLEEG